jgi:hypothetical protein
MNNWNTPRWLISIMRRHGHWEWEHEFQTCPAGDRHCNCNHYHYKSDELAWARNLFWHGWFKLVCWWVIDVRRKGEEDSPQYVLDAYDRSTAAYNAMPSKYRQVKE